MPFDSEFWTKLEARSLDEHCRVDRYLGPTGRAVDGGALFEATHQGRPARVEMTPASEGGAQAISRWKAAAAFSHPALATIYGHGVTRSGGFDLAYLATERGEECLGDVLAERFLTPAETREMLAPLLDALRYLHAQGFTHGALTPGNIMASADQLKIASGAIAAGGDPAVDSRAIGVLITDVLGSTDPARLPVPFNEIVRGCLQPDRPEERWTLAKIEARLRDRVPEEQTPASKTEDTGAPWFSSSRLAAIGAMAVGAVLLVGQVKSWLSAPTPVPSAAPAAAVPIAPQPTTPAQQTPPRPTPEPVVQDKPSASEPSPARRTREPQNTAAAEPPPAPPRPARPKIAVTPVGLEGTNRVMPDIPAHALNTITGRVRISTLLRVDAEGNVMAARLDPPASSKYFSARVLAAVRAWRFPASTAPRDVVVSFELTREQVRVAGASERRVVEGQ